MIYLLALGVVVIALKNSQICICVYNVYRNHPNKFGRQFCGFCWYHFIIPESKSIRINSLYCSLDVFFHSSVFQNLVFSFPYKKYLSLHFTFVMVIFNNGLLFINTSLRETIETFVRVSSKVKTHLDRLLKDSFYKLINSTMPESLILLDKKYYKQHDEVVAIVLPMIPPLISVFFFISCKNLPSELS